MDYLNHIVPSAGNSSEMALLLVLYIVAWGSQSAGLVVSRQWYLVPFAVGLVGLTGFLLNPIADSRTLFDIKTALLSRDSLLLLCGGQLFLTAACLMTTLYSVSSTCPERWRTALGFISCIPSPAVIVFALLLELQWLSSQAGARPELAGIGVGVFLALSMSLLCLLGAWLKQTFLIRFQLTCCLMTCILAGLLTTLGQSLPAVQTTQTFRQLIQESGLAVLITVALVAAGFLLERNHQTRQFQAPSDGKSS
ncbi:hypothetical protein V6x_32470 [Gimesia chilikensis]|uniref:Uncharacterized protein n=1 Tax=Gimesia chilikensis TaxID=2605989 RepID=A0A517WE45_9PLAN|nr:hypothetical protein [Gimesia chilikensis]QDU03526.1 hypothetical protein V6x_32470 [Gimesia chilikensis]